MTDTTKRIERAKRNAARYRMRARDSGGARLVELLPRDVMEAADDLTGLAVDLEEAHQTIASLQAQFEKLSQHAVEERERLKGELAVSQEVGHRWARTFAKCSLALGCDIDPDMADKEELSRMLSEYRHAMPQKINDLRSQLAQAGRDREAMRQTVQTWLDKQGHDRCWYYPDLFRELAKALDLKPSKEPALPPRAEFEEGCRRYQQEEFAALEGGAEKAEPTLIGRIIGTDRPVYACDNAFTACTEEAAGQDLGAGRGAGVATSRWRSGSEADERTRSTVP